METFNEKVTRLFQKHEALITRTNEPIEEGNGIFTRYKYPVVTAAHTPVFWRYDLLFQNLFHTLNFRVP